MWTLEQGDQVTDAAGNKTSVMRPSEQVSLSAKNARVVVTSGGIYLYPSNFLEVAKQAHQIETHLYELLCAKTTSDTSSKRLKDMLIMRRVDDDGVPCIVFDANQPSQPDSDDSERVDVTIVLEKVGIKNRRQLNVVWNMVTTPTPVVAQEEEPIDDERTDDAEADESSGIDLEERKNDIARYIKEEVSYLDSKSATLTELITAYKKTLAMAEDEDATEEEVEALTKMLRDFDDAKNTLLQ